MTNEELKAAIKECLNELAAEKVSNVNGFSFDSLSDDEKERIRESIINEFLEKGYENVNDWDEEKIKAANESCHSSSYYRKLINKLDLDFKVKEKLQKLNSMPECHAVIIKPPFGISTQWAYKAFDEGRGAEPPNTDIILSGLKNGSPEEICKGLGNVLEGPAIDAHPEIRQLKEQLLNAGAKGAMMSGSGPTVFGIFTDEKLAGDFYSAIKGGPYDCFKIKF